MSTIETVNDYLGSLPDERREIMSKVRAVIKKNLPKGYREVYNWGMISYEVPLKTYPNTYNKKPLMFCALGANKNNYSLHVMCAYIDGNKQKMIVDGYRAADKKLDMGKGCIRFKRLEDLPLDLVAKLIASTSVAEFIESYEAARKK